jgi:hypothetical protein
MILLDLKKRPMQLEDLLQVATEEPILLRALDGQEYVLELADDLDREAARLGDSAKFMEFLYTRASEPAALSLTAIRERLDSVTSE